MLPSLCSPVSLLQDITSLLHTIYEVVDASVNHSPSSSKTLRVKLSVAPDSSQRWRNCTQTNAGTERIAAADWFIALVLNGDCTARFQISGRVWALEQYHISTPLQSGTNKKYSWQHVMLVSIVWVSMLSSAAVSLDLLESVAVSGCWKNSITTKSDRPLHSTLSLPYYVRCCMCPFGRFLKKFLLRV